MIIPSVPPAATEPVLKAESYLYLLSSGSAIVDIVAAVAELEPQIAANPALAKTVVSAIPQMGDK